jgi:hypothetical protein
MLVFFIEGDLMVSYVDAIFSYVNHHFSYVSAQISYVTSFFSYVISFFRRHASYFRRQRQKVRLSNRSFTFFYQNTEKKLASLPEEVTTSFVNPI